MLSIKSDLKRGQAVAAQVCVSCHAIDAKSLSEVYPSLAGQHADYLYQQLKDFQLQPGAQEPQRNNKIMEAMVAILSDQDMRDVVDYYASQKEQRGLAHHDNPNSSILGEKIFRGGISQKGVPACVACHGPDGGGMPSQYPRLRGQNSAYTQAQLIAFRDETRVNNVAMQVIASRLSDDEIMALADYIADLR
nr:c-type cytochrome [Candidatus Pandoraea novymonadis]